jgi:hypothetical protein
VNVWGANALNPDLVAIDGFFNGVQTVSVSNANVTLSVPAGFTATPSPGPTQSQNAAIKFTGALTANVQITLPMPGSYIVHNLTTGAFVLTFAAPGAGQVISTEQGSAHRVYNDGTNVYFTDLPPVGTYLDTCDSAVPAWVTACTVPPYLLCNGATFNATTYPYLNAKLGGNTLPDARGRSRYMLGLGTGRLTVGGAGIDGTTLLAVGGSNGVALTLAELPGGINSSGAGVLTTINFPGNIPYTAGNIATFGTGVAGGANGPGGSNTWFNGGSSFSGTSANINVTSNNTGAQSFANAAPGFVGGITMIRSA